MSTFAELSSRQGVGVAYYFGVSLDKGVTALAYYGTHSINLGAAGWTEPRVAKLGSLSRALDITPMASHTIDIELDNVDGALDWISNRATVSSQLFSSLWYLNCYVFDPANPTDNATKTLGIFECMELPRRTASRISLTLSDRWQGRSFDFAPTPTLRDIAADLYSAGVLPDSNIDSCGCLIDPDMPLPLAFGDHAPALRICRGGAGYAGFIVCCTTDTSAADQGEIGNFGFGEGPNERYVYNGFDTAAYLQKTLGQYTLWSVVRSSTVSKGGKSWKVIFLKVDANAFVDSMRYADFAPMPDPNTPGNSWIDLVDTLLDKWTTFWVQAPMSFTGSVFSSRTYFSSANHGIGSIHGIDVAYDVVAYYSTLTTSDIDAAAFTAARSATPVFMWTTSVDVGGPVSGWQGNRLTKFIAYVAGKTNLDFFVNWAGNLSVCQKISMYGLLTNTLSSFDETLIVGEVEEHVPSSGERWFWNPETASYNDWGVLWSSWLSAFWANNGGNVVRPVVTFRYPLDALGFEIGDFCYFSWTRGGSLGPYTNAIFKIEALSLDPMSCDVEVVAVYMDDVRTWTNQPYLLDDETLIVRKASGGGRTATVQNSVGTVTFSSGSLITDGVAAGDLLVLLDATLGATDFTRFRALRITSVTDATHLVVTGDLAFGAAAPTAVSTWNIVKGKTTYPTAISDPTNYPSGSVFYGKTTNSTGTFSDASAGNQLLQG